MNDLFTTILDITTLDAFSGSLRIRRILSVRRSSASNGRGRGRRTYFIPFRPDVFVENQFLSPVVTLDFNWNKPRICRKRCRVAPDTDTNCSICLESMDRNNAVQLPCKHYLHVLCMVSLLPGMALGSRSMVRCPMCRYDIDRYDLGTMGFPVRVRDIVSAGTKCKTIRELRNEQNRTCDQVARLVRTSYQTCATDGLVYNVCVLSIERALRHRRMFMQSINLVTRLEEIELSLACHLTVLMHIPPEVME